MITTERKTLTCEMVDRFLSWPLPKSVCSDGVALLPGHADRSGTNLLSADEARAMLEYVTIPMQTLLSEAQDKWEEALNSAASLKRENAELLTALQRVLEELAINDAWAVNAAQLVRKAIRKATMEQQ